MKVELEVEDLDLLLKGLNNSLITYHEICSCVFLGCDIPFSSLRPLKNLPYEELEQRLLSVKNIYSQLEQLEQEQIKQKEFHYGK